MQRNDAPPVVSEGYTLAAPAAIAVRPVAHLRCALGIIPTANKQAIHCYWIHYFFTLHPFALCNTSLGDSFFFFFLSPPPPPANPCVLGLGVGVMGNAALCSRSAHGLWVPSLLPLHFGAFEGVRTIVSPMWSCSRRQGLCCYLRG